MRFDDALCRQTDPDLWFPELGGTGIVQARQARTICGHCPVIQACAQAALDGRELFGIWAGVAARNKTARTQWAAIAHDTMREAS
ncbi:WhiB family transcriptional regulator [Tomitella gaofuii]|uniref:WhiB family transcriptional regulator n=1 Tax=Tomitella gaofuii TaxID=2760083 RepID=UPI0015FA5FC5